MSFLQPTQSGKMDMDASDTLDPGGVSSLWSWLLRPLLFTVLLSVPVAYKNRLGRAEWTQVM